MPYQIPSYSPLSLGRIARAGLRALTSPGGAHADLERLLSERFASNGVLLTASGTHSLQVALRIATERAPGPVAVPAYSCYDIATAVAAAEVDPMFYDIDPQTLAPDLQGLREALGSGARVVVAGYLYGLPIDWTAVSELCESVGAVLIEDAAQGIGTEWGGSHSGTHGDLTVLSFGRGKGWTGGQGGALLARDDPWSAAVGNAAGTLAPTGALRGPKVAAATTAQWLLGRPTLYGIPARLPGLQLGETVYKEPGVARENVAFASAATALHEREAFAEIARRRESASLWEVAIAEAGLPDLGAHPCTPLEGGTCGSPRFPLRVSHPRGADNLVRELAHLGLGRSYPVALPALAPLVARSGPADRDFPGASELAGTLVTLPTHSKLPLAAIPRTVARLEGWLT